MSLCSFIDGCNFIFGRTAESRADGIEGRLTKCSERGRWWWLKTSGQTKARCWTLLAQWAGMISRCRELNFLFRCRPARYDYVEVEDLTEKTVLGRWCGSQSAPALHTSKGNQLRIHFVSDEYFPSEPGFCIRYSLLPPVGASSTVTGSRTHTHKSTQSCHVFLGDNAVYCQKLW